MITHSTINRLAALALLAMVWVAGFDTGRHHPAQSARPFAASPQ
jgi:hypothetical protein